MNKNKYLIGLIGVAVGFIISFFVTQNINKSNAAPGASGTASGTASGAGGAGGQQAMMGQVQAVLERAKNNPQDAQAQIEAAKTFYQIGRTKEALDYLYKAGEIEPNNIGIAVNLGALNSDLKNYPEAEKWLRHAIQLEPTESDLYVELGATFIQREPPQPDQAIVQLQQALGIDPKNGHALAHLVEAYALKKDARGAEDAVKRLKETDPTNQRISDLQTLVADLKAGKTVTIPKE